MLVSIKKKLKKKPSNISNVNFNKRSSAENLALEQKGLKYSIIFGGDWVRFYDDS